MPAQPQVPMQRTRRFVSIIGLSDERRIPRLGRIRLGHVNHNTQSSKSYPEEDSFFHVPEEVARAYGSDKPTELDIMFPVNDRRIIFPQAYEYYGSNKRLLCSGDGREAMRWNSQQLSMQATDCPCDLLGDGCKQRGHLLVMLPKVRQTGVYQIDTSSLMSIISINSFLHMLAPDDQPETGLLGYFAMVPLKLRRVPRDIHPKGHHRKSYPLELSLDATDEEIKELRAKKDEILLHTRKWVVQVPDQSNPEHDTGAIVTIDDKAPQDFATQLKTPADPAKDTSPATGAPEAPQPVIATAPDHSASSPSAPPKEPTAGSSPEIPNSTVPPTQRLPHTGTPAPVRPLRTDSMTAAQRARILSKTRAIQIPDHAVDAVITGLTKKQASEMINRIDGGDFSAFDRRETTEVPLPAAS